MTKTEQMIRFLKGKRKMTEVKSPSRKYRKFVGPRPGGGTVTYWIGKKGATRVGRTVSLSVSINYLIEPSMKIWEKRKKRKKLAVQ